MVGSFLRNFLKIVSVEFSTFLRKEKKQVKVISISPSTITKDSPEALRGNEKLSSVSEKQVNLVKRWNVPFLNMFNTSIDF